MAQLGLRDYRVTVRRERLYARERQLLLLRSRGVGEVVGLVVLCGTDVVVMVVVVVGVEVANLLLYLVLE